MATPMGIVHMEGPVDRFPKEFFMGPAALVMAHPGHELRILSWLAHAKPYVFLLTDGSGRTGLSRLDSTVSLIQSFGTGLCPSFGQFRDIVIYQNLLEHNFEFFLNLSDQLASSLIMRCVDYVVGDAADGYNPSHDVCRFIVNAALQIVAGTTGKLIRNYAFLLTGKPDGFAAPGSDGLIRIELTEAEFAEKLEAARNYASLSHEVERALSSVGLDAFRVEAFEPVAIGHETWFPYQHQPYYERHGELLVKAGHYSRVIRFDQHLLQLAEKLHAHTQGYLRCNAA